MNGNEVRVLGTEFNVRSYKDEKCQFTTLVTGKVLLTTYDRKCMELLPNEQGIVDPQGDIRKEQVDVALYTAWKDGNFVFRKQSLEHIMEIVERWYDLKVTFEDEWCKQVSFSGNVERYDDFSKLAEMLEATGSVKFRIKKVIKNMVDYEVYRPVYVRVRNAADGCGVQPRSKSDVVCERRFF